VNITSGEDLTLSEVTEAMDYIHSLCDTDDANIYFGTVIEPELEDEVRITVLATGFTPAHDPKLHRNGHAAVTAKPEFLPQQHQQQQFGTRVSPKDIWDQERPTNRQEPAKPEEIFEDNDIDIPAFLREHKKKQEEAARD
jgi:cell division protein FtsZ